MQVLRGEGALAGAGPAVATIGKFVVVHRGHRQLLDLVKAEAARLGALSAVVTFDRHPLEILAPDAVPCELATLDQRLEQFHEAGVDVVSVLEFTPELASLEPEEFVRRVLVDGLSARLVVVGTDFRFGRRRAGDIEVLTRLGSRMGFEVRALDLLRHSGAEISATTIRDCVLHGDVAEAARLMGRTYRLAGGVVAGRGAGSGLGFPTANLRASPRACMPGSGIYAARFLESERALPGVAYVGTDPTLAPRSTPGAEIHLFDFKGDLYGRRGEIEFVQRLRGDRRFESQRALLDQMALDCEQARLVLSASVGGDPGP